MSDLITLDALPSWRRSLVAKHRSENTISSYLLTVRQFDEFCRAEGIPTSPAEIRREHVEKFIGHTLATRSVNTAGVRYRNLVQFFRWLVEEDEVESHPMSRMTPPVAPDAPVPVLDDEALRRLLRAAEGKGFTERRDTAILRLFIDTPCRISEVTNLGVDDVDLDACEVSVVVKGGDRALNVFGPKTGVAIDRYLRLRPAHKHAASERLWLGPRGPLTRSGVQQMVERRGLQAGLGAIHAHQFRHTFVHYAKSQGMSDEDVMAHAHWNSPAMLRRYGKSLAAERAKEAYRKMNPGGRV